MISLIAMIVAGTFAAIPAAQADGGEGGVINGVTVGTDFRFTDVNFVPMDAGPDGILGTADDVQLPAVLGALLPANAANGKYDVKYVVQPKTGFVASTNPGQLYGVITIRGAGVKTVNLADTFLTQFDVNPAKLGGGVEVIRVDSTTGLATVLTYTAQVTSASVDNEKNMVYVNIALDTPLGKTEQLMIYTKFMTALKGQVPDKNDFVNNADVQITSDDGKVEINGETITQTAATATIEFV